MIKYQKRRFWKYRLFEDEAYATGIEIPEPIVTGFLSMTVDGLLTVRKGYVWDGASGPTIDTKNTFTASLIHDALYNLMRDNLLDRKHRRRADRILYEILRSRGMTRIRAKTWERAVRKGAASSAEYDVLTAP
jgi:hypothetical protein